MKGSSFVHISGLVTGMTEHEDRDGKRYAAMTVDAGVGTKRSTPVTVMLFERAYSWSTHYDLVGRHAGVTGSLYMAANSGLVVRAQRIKLHGEDMWARAWEAAKTTEAAIDEEGISPRDQTKDRSSAHKDIYVGRRLFPHHL